MPFSRAWTAAMLKKKRLRPGTKVLGGLSEGFSVSISMEVSVRELRPSCPMRGMSITSNGTFCSWQMVRAMSTSCACFCP